MITVREPFCEPPCLYIAAELRLSYLAQWKRKRQCVDDCASVPCTVEDVLQCSSAELDRVVVGDWDRLVCIWWKVESILIMRNLITTYLGI